LLADAGDVFSDADYTAGDALTSATSPWQGNISGSEFDVLTRVSLNDGGGGYRWHYPINGDFLAYAGGNGSPSFWQETLATFVTGQVYTFSVQHIRSSSSSSTQTYLEIGYMSGGSFTALKSTGVDAHTPKYNWSSTRSVSWTALAADAGKQVAARYRSNGAGNVAVTNISLQVDGDPAFIPEPVTLALLVTGSVGLLVRRRRRRC